MMPKVPQIILDEHPELVQVAAALTAYQAGKDVLTTCGVCGERLSVEEFSEVGVLVVTCPCGCTHYRTRWTPPESRSALASQARAKLDRLPEDVS